MKLSAKFFIFIFFINLFSINSFAIMEETVDQKVESYKTGDVKTREDHASWHHRLLDRITGNQEAQKEHTAAQEAQRQIKIENDKTQGKYLDMLHDNSWLSGVKRRLYHDQIQSAVKVADVNDLAERLLKHNDYEKILKTYDKNKQIEILKRLQKNEFNKQNLTELQNLRKNNIIRLIQQDLYEKFVNNSADFKNDDIKYLRIDSSFISKTTPKIIEAISKNNKMQYLTDEQKESILVYLKSIYDTTNKTVSGIKDNIRSEINDTAYDLLKDLAENQSNLNLNKDLRNSLINTLINTLNTVSEYYQDKINFSQRITKGPKNNTFTFKSDYRHNPYSITYVIKA